MFIVLFPVTRLVSYAFEISIKLFRFVHDFRARAQPYLKQFKMIKKMFYSMCSLSFEDWYKLLFPQDKMRLISLPSSPASPSGFLKLQFTLKFKVRRDFRCILTQYYNVDETVVLSRSLLFERDVLQVCAYMCVLSHMCLFAIPQTVARQAPLSIEFSG